MHDFCLTIPYAGLLIVGGVVGFLKKASVASLVAGVGSGLALCLAAALSLSSYHRGGMSMPALISETGIAVLLTAMMGQRYVQTKKFMPTGMVASISLIMTIFYASKLLTGGGNDIRKKGKTAD